MAGVQVAIYASKDPGGRRFLSTLRRRLKRAEIRAWEIRRVEPLTLVHSGDRYAGVRVTFTSSTAPAFGRAKENLGVFRTPLPSLLATISEGPAADRVLGFLVGMLTRHAQPLGVAGMGIPLDKSSR